MVWLVVWWASARMDCGQLIGQVEMKVSALLSCCSFTFYITVECSNNADDVNYV